MIVQESYNRPTEEGMQRFADLCELASGIHHLVDQYKQADAAASQGYDIAVSRKVRIVEVESALRAIVDVCRNGGPEYAAIKSREIAESALLPNSVLGSSQLSPTTPQPHNHQVDCPNDTTPSQKD